MDFYPIRGPMGGNTKVHINGKGFLPLKNELGEFIRTKVWIRMLEPGSRDLIGNVVEASYVDNENVEFFTPES